MLLLWSGHSHKKQKDSLETRAEHAVLRAYAENQTVNAFLSTVHQNINK